MACSSLLSSTVSTEHKHTMLEIEQNERILKVIHKHWFVLLGDLIFLFVALAAPVVFLVALSSIPIENAFSFSGTKFFAGGFFFFAWLAIVWMIAWKMWTTYYLDTIIITDKRVFDIDQHGLFSRESGSFRIDRIQNITVHQKGIIQTLLNFGSVQFETAGGNGEDFVAEYIGSPYEVKRLINQMQDGTLDKAQEVLLHSDTIERLGMTDSEDSTEKRATQQEGRGGKLGEHEGL